MTQPAPTPDPVQLEMRKQTELLRSINGKLGFIVFIVVVSIGFSIFALLLT